LFYLLTPIYLCDYNKNRMILAEVTTKGLRAIFAAIISFLLVWWLCACDTSGQGYSSRIVHITGPLKEPDYAMATMGGFSDTDPLNTSGDFIFKGRIDKISEVNITWEQVNKKGRSFTSNEWLTSCDVTIENVLYGEVWGIKDKIKVEFDLSTRGGLIEADFELKEGQEYYFLTRIFTEKEKTKENDPIKRYQFGDVQGGTNFDLFPINDGVVAFYRGWPFEGDKLAVITDDNGDKFEGVTGTIDEKSFLEQLLAMIQTAKSTLVPETTTPVEITITPTEQDATPTEPDVVQYLP
jgi:hypothetical protein